ALPPERLADELEVERDRRLHLARRDLRRRLAEQLAELALELTDAGLARVLGDDRREQEVVDRDLLFEQAVALALPRPEVIARDRHLLVNGVAVEADDLHPVEQRPRDRLGNVRGREEDDLR